MHKKIYSLFLTLWNRRILWNGQKQFWTYPINFFFQQFSGHYRHLILFDVNEFNLCANLFKKEVRLGLTRVAPLIENSLCSDKNWFNEISWVCFRWEQELKSLCKHAVIMLYIVYCFLSLALWRRRLLLELLQTNTYLILNRDKRQPNSITHTCNQTSCQA